MGKPCILVQSEYFWKGSAKGALARDYNLVHNTEFRVGSAVQSEVVALIVGEQSCTAEIMGSFPNLKTVARTATGYDNIDVEWARKHGIVVTRASKINGETAATFTVGLIIDLTRGITKSHQKLSTGTWERPLDALSLAELTIGIVGLGVMGRALAKKLHALGVKRILGWNRTWRPEVFAEVLDKIEVSQSLSEVMKNSDVVVICLALNDGTRGFIDRLLLSYLKRGAFLINTSRGAVADEEALIDMVAENRIAGVALDVYSVEPPLGEPWFQHLRALSATRNVILTPHIGSAVMDALEKTFAQVVKNVRGVLEGNMDGVEVVD